MKNKKINMKNKVFICIIIIGIIIGSIIIYSVRNCTTAMVDDKDDFMISVMYTDKNYKTTYALCSKNGVKLKELYSRENSDYSDYVIDIENKNLYYSNNNNGNHVISRLNLKNKNIEENILGSNFNGDILELKNNKLFFRIFDKNNQEHIIGLYDLNSLETKTIEKLNKDLSTYNFEANNDGTSIYAIERSKSEMEKLEYPNIPTNKIIKNYIDGDTRNELIYETNKYINSISLYENEKKIIFDAVDFNGFDMENSIYSVDLNSGSEEIILSVNEKINNEKIISIKYPKVDFENKGIYFLASTSESNIIEEVAGAPTIMANSIYYYDFKTKEIIKIFEVENAVINKFRLEKLK